MTTQPDSEETKTSNLMIQQGELHLSASAHTPLHMLRSLRFSNGEVCLVHDERRRLTEEDERKRLLEIINEAEQILEDNADSNNPSSA
jgi:hypothetical protein